MECGSLINLIAGNSAPEPEVGMGATELLWTDRDPYTIVEIIAPGHIKVRADEYRRTDGLGMSDAQNYEYAPDPHGREVDLRRSKDGRWYTKGGKKNGRRFVIGRREKYHDFSF